MFLKFLNKHPKTKLIYAVTGGKYLGELLVFMEAEGDSYFFLTLPDMQIREIPKEKFEFGLKENIVDIVKKIPSYVYKVCKAQYIKNKSSDSLLVAIK